MRNVRQKNSIMDKEAARKYLSATEAGYQASRLRFRNKIYANKSFKEEVIFKAGDFEFQLKPIQGKAKFETRNGLCIAFEITAITSNTILANPKVGLEKELQGFFALAQINFCLGLLTEEWQEINGEWIGFPSGGGEVFSLEVPGQEYIEKALAIHSAYQKVVAKKGKLGKKVSTCIALFRQGLSLEQLWPNESFLNFYKIIEIITESLKDKPLYEKLSNNPILDDFVSLNLIGDRTQRIKMYFLINAFSLNEFSKNDVVNLAEYRNKIAHTNFNIDHKHLTLCKDLSFEVFSKFVDLLVTESNIV